MFPLLPQKYAKANQTYFMKVKWSSQLNKQPKRLKKNLKKFRFDRESNRPNLFNDWTQRSIHYANQANL